MTLKNPGPVPKVEYCFNFCSWNLNSISVHDFFRVSLLEAFNIFHKFAFIAICETYLDSNFDLPASLVNADKVARPSYEFIKRNHPDDIKRGDTGLFYKDALCTLHRCSLCTGTEGVAVQPTVYTVP